jgi:fumarate reductase flavoprotein subunit
VPPPGECRRVRYKIDDNTELRRVLVENVPDTFRWLMSHGVEFYGPLPEPPHRRPRMHNVLPNSRAYIYHLGRAARKAGVRIVTSIRAQRCSSMRDASSASRATAPTGRSSTVRVGVSC